MTQTIIARHKDGDDEFCLGIVVQSRAGFEDADPLQALRAAAAEFCATDEGKAAIDEAAGNYNWGDLVNTLDEGILARHGFKIVDTFVTELVVDHNESLLPED